MDVTKSVCPCFPCCTVQLCLLASGMAEILQITVLTSQLSASGLLGRRMRACEGTGPAFAVTCLTSTPEPRLLYPSKAKAISSLAFQGQ